MFSSKSDIVSLNWFLFLADLLHSCLIVCGGNLHVREKYSHLLDSGYTAYNEYISILVNILNKG